MKHFKRKSSLRSVRGHHFLSNLIHENSVVVDLGAHLGQFSHEVSNLFGCKCYAVEALPSLYTEISETPLVKKFNYAICDRNHTVKLCVTDNPESNHITINNTQDEQIMISVNGTTLEEFIKKQKIESIDLLKVDIEGAEIELFKSISNEVLLNTKQITIEFHDFVFDIGREVESIKKRLSSVGFIYIVFSKVNNGDVLFINQHQCNVSAFYYMYLKYFAKYVRGVQRIVKRNYSKTTAQTKASFLNLL